MTHPPTATANPDFRFYYDRTYHGQSLHDWILATHREMARQSGWRASLLKPGQFGYDNLACSIDWVFLEWSRFSPTQPDTTLEQVAEWVHEGWCENFEYWRDQKPWLQQGFIRPKKPLTDARRDQCLKTYYSDLSVEEREKDRMIARYLLKETLTN